MSLLLNRGSVFTKNTVWDVNLLEWVAMTQPAGGGGTVDQGAAGSDPWLVTGTVTVDTTGLATSAKQDTGNTSLASIDGKLTNPLPISGSVSAAISGSIGNTSFIATQSTGTNLHTVVDSGSVTASVTGSVTANAGTNLNTSLLALESGGNLAAVKTNTDPFVTAGAGGFVRQDATATIALESGGNLAMLVTQTDPLTTVQQADGDGVIGPLVQSLVNESGPSYVDNIVAPISLTLGGRVRIISAGEEAATAWSEDDTGWNQRPAAMNFDTTNLINLDSVWSA